MNNFNGDKNSLPEAVSTIQSVIKNEQELLVKVLRDIDGAHADEILDSIVSEKESE